MRTSFTMFTIIMTQISAIIKVETAEPKQWRIFEGYNLGLKVSAALISKQHPAAEFCLMDCKRAPTCSAFAYNQEKRNCTESVCGRVFLIPEAGSKVYLKGLLYFFIIL